MKTNYETKDKHFSERFERRKAFINGNCGGNLIKDNVYLLWLES